MMSPNTPAAKLAGMVMGSMSVIFSFSLVFIYGIIMHGAYMQHEGVDLLPKTPPNISGWFHTHPFSTMRDEFGRHFNPDFGPVDRQVINTKLNVPSFVVSRSNEYYGTFPYQFGTSSVTSNSVYNPYPFYIYFFR